jgi:N6-adenosine-specific RNA methylase IME4
MSAEPFKVVIADPAWQFDDRLPGPKRGAAKHYHTLRTDGIKRLVLPPIARDAVLFMWRVSAMPTEALDVIAAWGFTVKSELVWVKTTQPCGSQLGGYVPGKTATIPPVTPAFGMGRYTRMGHEVCHIAVRGKGSRLIARHDVRSVMYAQRPTRHSEKPAEFYNLVEAMTEGAGPILELFSRHDRGGRFVCMGDEIGSEIAIRDEVGGLFGKVGG